MGFRHRLSFGGGVALLSLALAGCSQQVLLRRLPADVTGVQGPTQRCVAGQRPCATDPNQDDSRFSDSGTVTLPLPACPNGIDKILIQGAGSGSPVALVQCAAPSPTGGAGGGLPITQPGGGVGGP